MQECFNRDGVGARGGWINDETARRLTVDEVMDLLRTARKSAANLLLNIGPRGDGSVHPKDEQALREVGRRILTHGFPD
jgi:alpha-L-fucosidase